MQTNTGESLYMIPNIYGQLFSKKIPRPFSGQMTVFSINSDRRNLIFVCKIMKLYPYLTTGKN